MIICHSNKTPDLRGFFRNLLRFALPSNSCVEGGKTFALQPNIKKDPKKENMDLKMDPIWAKKHTQYGPTKVKK